MQIHQIIRKNDNKSRMIVGRGGKRGKTAGRGTKGQNARAGHKNRPELRERIKKLPKLRGRGVSSFKSFQPRPVVIRLSELETTFSNGDKVTARILVEKGLTETKHGVTPKIKVLDVGEITKKLEIIGCLVSKGAKAKIEKAGGSIK